MTELRLEVGVIHASWDLPSGSVGIGVFLREPGLWRDGSNNPYTYDALGRVTGVAYPSGDAVTFGYDAAGNRTQLTATSATPAPTVSAKTISTAYNTAGLVNLAPSGVYASVAVATAPTKGTVSIAGTTATYTPNASTYGSDSFTFTASGRGGVSAPATVSVTVAPPPAPTVSAKTISTAYNTAGSVNLAPSGVYASVAVASGPTKGSVSISGATATYTPTAGTYGTDSFTFRATGPGGTSAPATVSVTVGNPAVPTVSNKTITASYNTSIALDLAPQGVWSSIAFPSGPAKGALSRSGSIVTYTPTAGTYGADSFTFTATGSGGTSAAATVSVSVTVTAPQPPVLSPISVTTQKNTAVTFSGTTGAWDPDELVMTLVGTGTPTHGAATSSGGMITYTPTTGYIGSDSFSYTVANTTGAQSTSTVSVTVQAPATAPAVSLSSAYWRWSYYGYGSPTIDPAIAVSVSGGTPAYTYVWQYVSGDTQIAPVSATSLSTGFQRTVSGDGDWIAYWRCKVTDSTGAVAYSPSLRVEFYAGSEL